MDLYKTNGSIVYIDFEGTWELLSGTHSDILMSIYTSSYSINGSWIYLWRYEDIHFPAQKKSVRRLLTPIEGYINRCMNSGKEGNNDLTEVFGS